jgi:hypothetical protein
MSASGNAINKVTGLPKQDATCGKNASGSQKGFGAGLEKLLGDMGRSLGLEGMSKLK